ncbi:unnamed protein product [Ophioblennius macclurei]
MMENLIAPLFILFSVLMPATGVQHVIYAQVGDNITLKNSGESQDYISWYFGETEQLQLGWLNPLGGISVIQDKNWPVSLTSISLTIKTLKDEQFGKFTCKVKSSSREDRDSYILIKVKVVKKATSVFLPGETLSLGCDVEVPQGHEKPDIHWLDPQSARVKNDQATLNKIVERGDNGSWTCVIADKKKVQIPVAVVDLAPAPEHHYTSTNSPLTLLCSLPTHISWEQIKQKGVQEIQWHFSPTRPSSSPASDERLRLMHLSLETPPTWKTDQDKDLRPVSDLTKGNLSLHRSRARVEDRGDYTCSMTFKHVTLKRTVHVQVLQITSSPGPEVISGQSVNLSCGTGEPLASGVKLKWFPPEQSSESPKPDHHGAHLTIKEAGAEHGGQWRCELWRNEQSLTSAAIKITVEPKLSAWMLVIICSCAVIPVLLFILIFILCRRRQRKTKHHKHRLCKCKNPKPKGFYRT